MTSFALVRYADGNPYYLMDMDGNFHNWTSKAIKYDTRQEAEIQALHVMQWLKETHNQIVHINVESII